MQKIDSVDGVLENFPNVKLSYEEFIHKKVSDADIILAIPQGKKCYIWFTTLKKQYVCYLIELGRQNKVEKVHLLPACFNKELCYGSVFYGTMFLYNRRQFVTFENVFYYKGERVTLYNYLKKLQILKDTLANDIQNLPTNKLFTSFGLPPMHNSHEKLVEMISPKQRIMYFQYRFFNKNNVYRVKPSIILHPNNDEPICSSELLSSTKPKPESNKTKKPNHQANEKQIKPKKVIQKEFEITACLQNDIYMIHGLEAGKQTGIACIPDYKTSVMMNQLFRTIKENDNLDALEESDDEDEFEDEREDKFVDLEKRVLMLCTYNHRFKKWVPTKVISD